MDWALPTTISVKLTKATAVTIGVAKSTDKASEFLVEGVFFKETNAFFKFTYLVNKRKKKIEFTKKALSVSEKLCAGFLFLYSGKKEMVERGKKLLEDSIVCGINSAVPFLLLVKNQLYTHGGPVNLSDVERCKDVSPAVYKELIRLEKSKLRAVGLAKKAINKFEQKDYFVWYVSKNLYELGEYEEAYKFIIDNKEKVSRADDTDQFDFLVTLFYSLCLKLKKFEEAEEVVKYIMFEQINVSALMGVSKFMSGDLDDAQKIFLEVVEDGIERSDETRMALFFLLDIYRQKKLLGKFLQVIEELHFYSDNFCLTFGDFDYSYIIEAPLHSCIQFATDTYAKAKLSIIYTYLIYNSNFAQFEYLDEERKYSLQQKNIIKKCLETCRAGIECYGDVKFVQTFYSKLLYLSGKFDEAKEYAIRAELNPKHDEMEKTISNSCPLSRCSEIFLSKYPKLVAELTKGGDEQEYVEFEFSTDVEQLYDKKRYDVIVELFHVVSMKHSLDELYESGALFKVAYSLWEHRNYDAKAVYEFILTREPKNTACLNNLHNIYLEMGNVENAKLLIKKAKQLCGEKYDAVIFRNYESLFQAGETGLPNFINEVKQDITMPKLPVPTFDNRTGKLIFGTEPEKAVKVCESGSQECFIVNKLFNEIPVGKQLDETEFETGNYIGESGSINWIKFAVIRLNRKTKKMIGCPVILHRRGRLQIAFENFEH